MNQKFVLIWAVTATALALVFLGFILGKRTAGESVRAAHAPAYGSPDTGGSSGNQQEEVGEPFIVPGTFAGLPAEWRTPFDGRDTNGYAILFDPERREVIVEKCHHPGYFDARSGAVIEPGWAFCDGVLWGSMMRIDEESATVVDRKRETIELELALARDTGEPRLSLSFPGHDMVLIPGSKNDLLQALENSPAIQKQKDRYIKLTIATEDALRRVVQEAGPEAGAADVPVYTLPATEERPGETE